MATVAKGYDLDYAWRAVGEAYQGAGYDLAAAEAGEPPGRWWGPGAELLGLAQGQQVEREPYNLLFGQRKGPHGQKLGRAPANAGKAVEIYKGLASAEPGADDHRRAELRIIAQRQARHAAVLRPPNWCRGSRPSTARAPNQRELASLMDKANLRTRKGKDGVLDWDAATRGWQAKAAQRVGVDLASLYRRVSRLERSGDGPRDAGPELTQDDIARATQKALERCSREASTWTRADLVANLGRELPRRGGDPVRQAALLEEVADSAVAGDFGEVVCLDAPEATRAPQSLQRADDRSLY